MVRKLTTFVTSIGFFDVAVAAPSMKAALEAWNSSSNLFHQGFAQKSDDPDIVSVTMSKPGAVFKRAVGSNDKFSEHAELSKDLPSKDPSPKSVKTKGRAPKPAPIDGDTAHEAAISFEKERKRRQNQRMKDETARQKARLRQERAIASAKAALQNAKDEHERRMAEIEEARGVLNKRAEKEELRWQHQFQQLEAAIKAAQRLG